MSPPLRLYDPEYNELAPDTDARIFHQAGDLIVCPDGIFRGPHLGFLCPISSVSSELVVVTGRRTAEETPPFHELSVLPNWQRFRIASHWRFDRAEERLLFEQLERGPAIARTIAQKLAVLLMRGGRLPLQRAELVKPGNLLRQLLSLGVYESAPALSMQLLAELPIRVV